MNGIKTYCLDTNVLIQAWQKYYSPQYCPDYWQLLNKLGIDKRIYIPKEVFNEIDKTDDELKEWLKSSSIPVMDADDIVANCLKEIYSKNTEHSRLVDSIKGRSLADPWVIAHAMKTGSCVVTKEEFSTTKIKIPNVCVNMDIRCINDFELIKELNIQFSCNIP